MDINHQNKIITSVVYFNTEVYLNIVRNPRTRQYNITSNTITYLIVNHTPKGNYVNF